MSLPSSREMEVLPHVAAFRYLTEVLYPTISPHRRIAPQE